MNTAAPEPLASAHGLIKEFDGRRALDDIHLDVAPGTIVGLIGPSGCGKTTLIRTLTGVLPPTAGDVRVFGVDPSTFGVAERLRFGYMPQIPVLFPNLTMWGNLTFVASIYGMSLRGRRRRLHELLDLVELDDHRTKLLAEASGGMQRRLSLAATLVHDPDLLFLDEPTAGIDPILRDRFWAHFRELRDQGRTLFVSTQYVGEAVSCDLVAVMSDGRLIAIAPPEQLAEVAYGGRPLLVTIGTGWVPPATIDRLASLPFVRGVDRADEGLVVTLDGGADADDATVQVRRFFDDLAAEVTDVQPLEPTYDELFVRIVEADRRAQREEAPA